MDRVVKTMNNDVKLLPLKKYEVFLASFEGPINIDVFTADDRQFDVVDNSLKFYRTGNLIREYFDPHSTVRKVVATPV